MPYAVEPVEKGFQEKPGMMILMVVTMLFEHNRPISAVELDLEYCAADTCQKVGVKNTRGLPKRAEPPTRRAILVFLGGERPPEENSHCANDN